MANQGTQTPDNNAPPEPAGGAASRPRARLGPGLLVTAAFIGPGTVTTATLVGADFGFDLVWALAFAMVTAMVLQEMSARLGIVSKEGLGEAMRTTFRNPAVSYGAIALVVLAIAVGNSAFQGGNLTGAGLGLETILGASPQLWSGIVGAGAFILLLTGAYRVIERVVIALVVIMSIVFVVTAVIVQPDIGELLGGLVPRVPTGATLTVVALIGTTVVPYNLFLHASSVREKWSGDVPVDQALPEARKDTYLSIGLGGLITLAIITTAATVIFTRGIEVEGAGEMAAQLEPLLGPAAQGFFAAGLFGAGLTSAITAPLATAYAVCGAVGWRPDLKSFKFRAVWATVIVIGTTFAVLGESPVAAILFAQATNGLLLPIVAVFLLVVMNRRNLLGKHRNGPGRNTLGITVVLIAVGLGVLNILSVLGITG